MKNLLIRFVCSTLMACMGTIPLGAYAGMVGTGQVVTAARTQDARALLREFVSRSELRNQLQDLGIDPAAARMARATPHDLRRTSASWNASAGANMALVAASLGHAPGSAVTLRHYAHAEQTAVRGMLESFATRALRQESKP